MRQIFTHGKLRTLLAVFGPFLTTIVMIPGMTTYLPVSDADQIILPILFFPLLWLGLLFACYLLPKVRYVLTLLGLIITSHGYLAYLGFTGALA